MGNAQSAADKVYKYSRGGEYYQLRALLEELEGSSPEFSCSPGAVLDVPDEEGNTPLIVAASRGYFQVVELLLQHGASLHPQNRRADGGSALQEAVARRQDHVVDLLLQKGANAFVENARGFTAMDLACSARSVDLLRRIETCAPWSGWLVHKVPRLAGLSAEWERRWVVVSHRFPHPGTSPDRRLVHVVLCCFKATNSTTPSCRAWLDGAKAEEVRNERALERTGGRGPAQVDLRLHRKHAMPSGTHATGNTQTGFTLHFRPDDVSPAGCEAFRAFMLTVNNRGYPPVAPPPAAAAAAAAPAAAAHPTPPPRAAASATYSPLGAAASRVSAASPGAAAAAGADDAELARRLQVEEDAAFARRLQNTPSIGDRQGSAAAAPVQPSRPPASQPSQDVSSLCPPARGDGSAAPPPTPGRPGLVSTSHLAASRLPSAPTMGSSPAAAPSADDEDNVCLVCFDREIQVGFLHGDTVHKKCCRECAARVMQGNKLCPSCRAPIERVVAIF